MANSLGMSQRQQVVALLRLGWGVRKVARETGRHRATVERIAVDLGLKAAAPAANCTITPADPLAGTVAGLARCSGQRRPFVAAVFAAEITAFVARGETAQVIYQQLVERHGYAHSYDSVKRYVRHLRALHHTATRRVVGVMHHAPGEEAQVDYFQGAPTWHPERQRYVRPWVFRMTLCHSRHGYEEPVWRLDLPTFLRLHERAFRALRGVPQVIRHDNMTAGVSRACFIDPDSNVRYLAFAAHWNFAPLPTRPYTPQENGKEERAGGYVKHNAYTKDLRFSGPDALAQHAAHLVRWNARWAQTRIHGTTRRQVLAHFLDVEQPALQPCPADNFALFECGMRTVHVDGHIEVHGAFYPLPWERVTRLLGARVQVRWDEHLVRIYHDTVEVIVHARRPPGTWALAPGQRADVLVSSQRAHLTTLIRRCGDVAPALKRWAEAAFAVRGIRTFKLLQGVLGLVKKTPVSRAIIASAADSAQQLNHYRYKQFQQHLARHTRKAGLTPSPERALLTEHPVIRDMAQYTLADLLHAAAPHLLSTDDR
jgi:transposase